MNLDGNKIASCNFDGYDYCGINVKTQYNSTVQNVFVINKCPLNYLINKQS